MSPGSLSFYRQPLNQIHHIRRHQHTTFTLDQLLDMRIHGVDEDPSKNCRRQE
jgi:hypothetical protein